VYFLIKYAHGITNISKMAPIKFDFARLATVDNSNSSTTHSGYAIKASQIIL
jgi:hypothetical protein